MVNFPVNQGPNYMAHWSDYFMGGMPFLSPKQQQESTGGNKSKETYVIEEAFQSF